jgi:hypothetical protein
MIAVRLMGGLGNQMFQYAVARRIALERSTELVLDLGWFGRQAPQDTPRAYALDVFVADDHVRRVAIDLPVPVNRLQAGIALVRERLHRGPRIVRQRGTGFDAQVLDAPDGALLVGYFQSERYFGPVADAIRTDFALRAALSPAAEQVAEKIAAAGASISLHVRRGDYVTNPNAKQFHGTLGSDHYRRALGRIDRPDAQVFVFSDDPDWCAAELELGQPTTVLPRDGRSAAEDMVLMSRCDHHVIANSSFSWWGAWLDPRPEATVVAPARWALDAEADFADVCPPRWLRV